MVCKTRFVNEKSINITHNTNRIQENHMIISTDTEKAFDQKLIFIIQTLTKLGIKESCLNLIKNINKNPTTDTRA